MNHEKLLRRLPPDVPVMNCSHCGRLMTSSPGIAARYRDAGLRCLGGYVREPFHGGLLDRPQCMDCFASVPSVYRGPAHGRSEGQRSKLPSDL